MNKWTCDSCGELHDSQFDSCWHCGAYRVINSEEQEYSDFTAQTGVSTPLRNVEKTKLVFRSEWYPRILSNMRKKTSDKLVEILNSRHKDEWSEETFVAVREVLAERNFPMPVVESDNSCCTDTAADTLGEAHEDLPASSTEVIPVEIFIAKREQRTGPFTIQQIETMISSEMIDVTDLAWHLGLSGWLPLHEVLGICPPLPQITSNADNPSSIYCQLNNVQDTPNTFPSQPEIPSVRENHNELRAAQATWIAPSSNIKTKCPFCNNTLKYSNVSIPAKANCKKCNNTFVINKVTYSASNSLISIMGMLLLSMISVFELVQANILSMKDYLILFGRKSNNLDLLIGVVYWGIIAFVPLLILSILVGYFGITKSRAKLSLSSSASIVGGMSTIGWIVVVPYLAIWAYSGHIKLSNERDAEKIRAQERMNSYLSRPNVTDEFRDSNRIR